MATWEEMARLIIETVDAQLPPDASVKERKAAYRAAKPHEYATTSWGCKTWGRAQRKVLAKYAPKSDAAVPSSHLSPLERMMARAGQ